MGSMKTTNKLIFSIPVYIIVFIIVYILCESIPSIISCFIPAIVVINMALINCIFQLTDYCSNVELVYKTAIDDRFRKCDENDVALDNNQKVFAKKILKELDIVKKQLRMK